VPTIPQFIPEKNKILEDNALHYVSGYLTKKIKFWHDCTVCNDMFQADISSYPKRNELYTKLKAYNENCHLHNVSQSFHYYVKELEKKLLDNIDECIIKSNVCKVIVKKLKDINVPTKCTGFPKIKFLYFFARLRIFYILKFKNATLTNSSKLTHAQKKYKEFQHL
jgi:hypothetical protein